MFIFCCGCQINIEARLTNGSEIYPHRPELEMKNFYKCDFCNNYVGCHDEYKTVPMPLGCIPTEEIRKKRKQIHSIIDPLWQSGRFKRKALYKRLSDLLGYKYHTAAIRSIEEADKIIKILKSTKGENDARRDKKNS